MKSYTALVLTEQLSFNLGLMRLVAAWGADWSTSL
jgi:hypothetical protein